MKTPSFPLFVLAALMWPSACGHTPPPPCTTPEPLVVSIAAAADVNPDNAGNPLPTVVRVYQLRSAIPLETLTLDELVRSEQESLGQDLLRVQEVVVDPSGREEVRLDRHAEARQVAVVGLFRSPAGLTWRTIQKLPPPDPQHCHRAKDERKVRSDQKTATGSRQVVADLRVFLRENRVEVLR